MSSAASDVYKRQDVREVKKVFSEEMMTKLRYKGRGGANKAKSGEENIEVRRKWYVKKDL